MAQAITKNRRGEFYHVKLGRKFYWEEVDSFIELWSEGMHLVDIANKLGCEVEEAFILALDLTVQGTIDNRPHGVFGH